MADKKLNLTNVNFNGKDHEIIPAEKMDDVRAYILKIEKMLKELKALVGAE